MIELRSKALKGSYKRGLWKKSLTYTEVNIPKPFREVIQDMSKKRQAKDKKKRVRNIARQKNTGERKF